MIRKIIVACMIIFFTAAIPVTVFAEDEFIPIDGNKTRDYLKAGDIFRATGYGTHPLNFDNRDSFAKTFARQAARLDALRQLHIICNMRAIEDWLNDKPLQKMLKNHARQVGNAKFLDNDICEVTMEVVVPADWNN